MATNSRMTSFQRREQLIGIGRSLFASKGFESVSVEEIAAHAKVSKPIVYEHFGGKEGLYAVVVDREMRALSQTLFNALSDDSTTHPRRIVERAALALLTYIEENSEGFQVLVRDSPMSDANSSFSSLWGDISLRVEDILGTWFKRQHLPMDGVAYYAQMLVGMTVFTGQYWADQRKMSKEQLAALIVNLAWNGLSRLKADPKLLYAVDEPDDGMEGVEVVADAMATNDADAVQEEPQPQENPKERRAREKAELKAEREREKAREKAEARLEKAEAKAEKEREKAHREREKAERRAAKEAQKEARAAQEEANEVRQEELLAD